MELSHDLIKDFISLSKTDDETTKSEHAYGTIAQMADNSGTGVQLDGSQYVTPAARTTSFKIGDRVEVYIANHTATVLGNYTDPSASSNKVEALNDAVNLQGSSISAINSNIDIMNSTIEANSSNIQIINTNINQVNSNIDQVNTNIEQVNTNINEVNTKINTINSDLEITDSKISVINSAFTIEDGVVTGLKGLDGLDFIKTKDLTTESLNSKYADITFANVNFADIGLAKMKEFYAESGIIGNATIKDGQITGTLIGVEIQGDLIKGNTIVADKLVIQGEDGLYYKLNTDGETVVKEQTDYNSLHGSIIKAKSITATQISVSDLVAFDATIGGFKITEDSIHSIAKDSVDSGIYGIYMDQLGQVAFGDANNYVKYYKDTDGTYKLSVSAGSIMLGTSKKTSVETALTEAQEKVNSAIVSSIEQFYQSDSPTSLSSGEWSMVEPVWKDGKYLWRRTKITYGDGRSEYTPSENGVCITGNTGARGLQGLQGEKGEQGIPGAAGETGPQGPQGDKGDTGSAGKDGKTSYFHIKYSSVANPTSSSQMTETPSTYIGTYVDYTETDSTDPSKYSWSRFQGAQGAKGDQGIAGVNGVDGKTSYLHIAYANSADGKTGFDVSTSTNKLYIGQYTDFTSADSTDPTKYSWSKIKGDKGDTGSAGKDAIVLTITASNGIVFKNNAGSTVLTAHVYLGGVEQSITDAGVCGTLGSIKWYKGSSTTAVSTAKTLTVLASNVTNSETYTCNLEK